MTVHGEEVHVAVTVDPSAAVAVTRYPDTTAPFVLPGVKVMRAEPRVSVASAAVMAGAAGADAVGVPEEGRLSGPVTVAVTALTTTA